MITTHVVDTAKGRPGTLIPVQLDYFLTGHGWREVGHGVTNQEGLVEAFGEPEAAGIYRLAYDIAAYQMDPFFPTVNITFQIHGLDESCHIALLLSPYGYSVGRG